MTIEEETKLAENIVRDILEKHPEARNSRTELLIQYYQHEGMELSLYQQNILRGLLSMETITRSARHIQNDKKQLMANEKVQMLRKKKEVKIREIAMKYWELIPGTNTMREVY